MFRGNLKHKSIKIMENDAKTFSNEEMDKKYGSAWRKRTLSGGGAGVSKSDRDKIGIAAYRERKSEIRETTAETRSKSKSKMKE